MVCHECSIDGHYGDVSNSNDMKCVDAGNRIDGCLKYLTDSYCTVCKPGKVL